MILCFSGTGNSRHVARRIAEATGDEVLDLFDCIRRGDCSPLRSSRPWVLVTPTYAWRIPRIVEAWLRRTELSESREIYFVMTCGDSIGNAGRYARRLAADKKMAFRGCAAVVMPENYIALFDAPDEAHAREIVAAADAPIRAIAQRIAAGEPLSELRPRLRGRLCSGPVNPVFYRLIVKDRKFRIAGNCVACGYCAAHCPTNNIVLADGRPCWRGNCTHCMACICGCPQAAIEYGRASLGKPRYRCPEA